MHSQLTLRQKVNPVVTLSARFIPQECLHQHLK